MAAFQNEQELYPCLAGIFERAFKDPVVGPKAMKSGLRMRVEYSEPDAVMLVDMANGKVYTGDEGKPMEWDVSLAMTADDGHLFWLGKLNFTVAMTKGRIRTKGPITELLKLLPLAKPLFAQYEQLLQESDRQDLLAMAR